ncbi:MAG: D-2-hydroxyacid dehydrogenase [Eggerthellaceae bacterium]|nr:D-2-hydroxyacid dehydrogenase [Eggerthellaceae bacterium]
MAEQKNILVVIPVDDETKQRMEAAVDGGQYDCSFTYMPTRVPTDDELAAGANISVELMRDVTEEDLAGQQVIIGSVPPALLKSADGLEWLQLSWAGVDSFVAPGVLAEDVVLTNASGAYGLTCSEHMLAQTLALVRNIPEYVRNQEQHLWKQNTRHISIEGSTVLCLGLGDIGGSYARKMKALGATVIGVRRNASLVPDYCDEVVSIDEIDSVLPRADIVANSLPGSAATFHLMNEDRLRAMKPGAYFVNVGRGNVLDQEAAKRVLADGHLGGLGLDVFESEPLPEDDELWDDPRVLVTPHVAGQFFLQTTFDRMVDICVENLRAWAHGEALSTLVSRELGY